MIFKMYSIKDEQVGFAAPLPMVSDNVAKRYFLDQIKGNPTMHNTPADFSIWSVGTFDTASGTFIQKKDDLKEIERGSNYVSSEATIQNSAQ